MADYKKSKLLPVGLILIALGLLAPVPIEMVAHGIESMGETDGPASMFIGLLMIGADLLRLLFFAGVACVIIGALRNHRSRRQSGAAS